MNEAAIQAARDDRAYIIKEDIDKSFIKVGIGTEKKSRVVPESERRITAYHESGHAILFHLLPDVGPVQEQGQQDIQCRFQRMIMYS